MDNLGLLTRRCSSPAALDVHGRTVLPYAAGLLRGRVVRRIPGVQLCP
jgi:hypothetical protein